MDVQFVVASLLHHLKRWPEVLLAFSCFLFVRWYLKEKKQGIMYIPLLGEVPELLLSVKHLPERSTEIFNTLGNGSFILKGHIFSKFNYLVTCNPQNHEYILKKPTDFPKGSRYKEIFEVLGDGIFNSDFDLWRTQRKMAQMRFMAKDFRVFAENICNKVVEESVFPLFTSLARQGSQADLQDIFMRFSFDINFFSIFGSNPGSLWMNFPDNEFAKAVNVSLEAVLYRYARPGLLWKLLRWLSIGNERKMVKAWKTLDGFIANCISERKKNLTNGGDANDLLSTYIFFEKEKRNELVSKGDKFLRDTTLNFLIAGRDTTSSALTWFFWLISKNPHVEEKILQELNLVFSTKAKDEPILGATKRPWLFVSEDLKECVYLHAAVCESLRLYPPLPNNHKTVLKDDVLPDGTVVKPGMEIILATYAMARMKWVWGEDCTEFKPERWIGYDGKLIYELMSRFFVFGVGPRTCLGKDMTITTIKSTIAAILFNFHVEVVEGQQITQRPSIILHITNGLMVKIKERTGYIL